MKLNSFLFSLSILLTFTACGETDTQTTTTLPTDQLQEETTPTITGVFLDSPVSGLHYQCFNGREGNTTAKGEFTCDINNTKIRFDIPQDGCCNDITLGNYTDIKTIITPSDLSTDSASVLRMLQLLQTLDVDKNASNGIAIDPLLVTKLNDEFIYFSAEDFDRRIEDALEISIVSPEVAYAHYEKSLEDKNLPLLTVDHTRPLFTSVNSVTLYENQKNVLDINATDDNPITYKIEKASASFIIDEQTGELTFSTIGNYESASSYTVEISASDGVNIAYQTLNIKLLDIDENRPLINVLSSLTVDENQFFAFDINASDESPLTYTLSGTDASYFDVNQSSGIVTFKTLSDYENGHSPYYYVSIDVKDTLNNSSSQNITLRLNPINDNIPVITVESIHNIYENTYSPKIPFSIADEDLNNDAFTVSLIGDDASFFSVVSSTTVGDKTISFIGTPDYETQKHSYSFQLKLQDGNYTIIKDINVNILDVDENPPILTLPETLTVDENQLKILDVNATDENQLTYSVVGRIPYSSNNDTIFSIDNNGTLSWKIDPDYETSNYWKTYYADVTVSDGINSVTKMITIKLRNVNDNAPVITSPSNITLPENELQVLRVTTTDADNETGWIEERSFSIKDGDSAFFDINSSTGNLTFKTAPDYENNKHNYTLTLEVSDANFTTPQTLNIAITDVDEKPPIFTTTNTNVTVDENQLSVMQVNATDENNITYRLQSGDYYSFDINQTSGLITFKNLTYADYERKNILNFQVSASDGLNTSTQDITVNLTNLNDNTPTIVGFTTVNIYENSTIVSLYTIEDADDDNITISLNNSLFDYNSSSNYLSFKDAPDYESDPHLYSVTLTASDGLYSTNIDITVNLFNKDDVVPTLNNFTATIDENTPIGTVVGTISVSSSGDSNITSYTLSGTNYSHFSINSSGEITTNADIDYETISQYDLTVKAQNTAGYSELKSVTIVINNIAEKVVPTLVVVMNWNNYNAGTASEWYDKIFNKNSNSVAKWYQESTNGEISFIPVSENSGTSNDGIIMVDMGINHPGGSNDTDFRDTHITNAITSSTIVDSVDFAALDTNANGDLDISEIQIIFIVAGGEESYGDPQSSSIWAHAWSFGSSSTLSVDGVTVMKYNGDRATSGSYSRFGANHGDHLAAIGIIVHELGHAMLSLRDFYDDGGGSGLGWYDVMSGGSWAYQDLDTYSGDTPTQFSTYNKELAGLNMNIRSISSSATLTIECSSNDAIKLTTSTTDEYFLIECRDTEKENSDISMNNAYNGGFSPNDNASFANRLFSVVYHVDDTKTDNTEDGSQTSSYHYNIAVVEKDTTHFMTSTTYIEADYNDVLIEGETLGTTRTKLYDGTATGYAIEITSADYNNKTMTIRITR